jgi:citrate lyase beta subunit
VPLRPGSSEKFLAKAPTLDADMFFLDLEDAVAPLEKEAARAKVVAAVREQDWGDAVLCVRVNAWDTKWTYGDVIEVVGQAGPRLDEIMLPKVQSAAQVVAMDLLLTQVEINHGLPSRPHRHRSADRDGAGPHQRRGDLCCVPPSGDGHPGAGRLLGVDGHAVAVGRAPDTGVSG